MKKEILVIFGIYLLQEIKKQNLTKYDEIH